MSRIAELISLALTIGDMFVERTASAYPSAYLALEGEVIFFSGREYMHRLADRVLLPNRSAVARMGIMEDVDTVETPINDQPEFVKKTEDALGDLSKKAIFQRNPAIAGSVHRISTDQGWQIESLPETAVNGIKQNLYDELVQTNSFGEKAPAEKRFGDVFNKAYTLADLRQAAGTLDTGDPQLNRQIEDTWLHLNGRLFALNRTGNNDSVLSDLRLASLLKKAFPERTSKIDVYDVPTANGKVIKGQAVEVAERYLKRAQNGRIFDWEPQGVIKIVPRQGNISNVRPIYQSEMISETSYHLGSPSVAYLTIARFLSDFFPEHPLLLDLDQRVILKAQKDLSDFATKNPQFYSDPNMVLLFSEHLSNLHQAEKFGQRKPDSQVSMPVLKSA